MFADQVLQRLFRSAQIFTRLEGVDRCCIQQLTGLVHNRNLAACPYSGVKAKRRARARRCRQQQVSQITCKNIDGGGMGPAAQICQQVHEHR